MWVVGLLVVLLPLALPTTVVYYPILPFPRLPMLMTPPVYPKMGNRPFEKSIEKKEPPSGYHTCHDHTAEWHEWEAGSSGTIKVKRNGSRLAATPWDLKLVFTHPVSLQAHNRQTIFLETSRCYRSTMEWLMSVLGQNSRWPPHRGVSDEALQARRIG